MQVLDHAYIDAFESNGFQEFRFFLIRCIIGSCSPMGSKWVQHISLYSMRKVLQDGLGMGIGVAAAEVSFEIAAASDLHINQPAWTSPYHNRTCFSRKAYYTIIGVNRTFRRKEGVWTCAAKGVGFGTLDNMKEEEKECAARNRDCLARQRLAHDVRDRRLALQCTTSSGAEQRRGGGGGPNSSSTESGDVIWRGTTRHSQRLQVSAMGASGGAPEPAASLGFTSTSTMRGPGSGPSRSSEDEERLTSVLEQPLLQEHGPGR
ncbi:hypothetical protein AXG93_1054s1140 [Marchantia polymorpha subsp. ruderalis]|uniref:Uncharacterized protein n=1 Tax=Marchantia polymorpha subsp. ruderalis TaxID=1480154 RepID=A0A176WME9_MARPO|nr:hypothetical protein AXG93_1054s1140 [Marchantia polymorpha subsp. ruderalis]